MILSVLKMFTVTKADLFDYRFQYQQGVPGTGQSVNLTAATASCALTSWDGLTTHQTLVSGATPGTSGLFFGGSNSDPTNGIIDIVIIPADTTNFTWKYARYNLALTTTAFGLQRLMYGSFAVVGFLP